MLCLVHESLSHMPGRMSLLLWANQFWYGDVDMEKTVGDSDSLICKQCLISARLPETSRDNLHALDTFAHIVHPVESACNVSHFCVPMIAQETAVKLRMLVAELRLVTGIPSSTPGVDLVDVTCACLGPAGHDVVDDSFAATASSSQMAS